MVRAKTLVVVLTVGLGATGCSVGSEALWPSLSAEPPRAGPAMTPGATTAAAPVAVTPIVPVTAPATTVVGMKVNELRAGHRQLQADVGRMREELQGLRGQSALHSQGYFGLVGAISSRLAVGTTPGNPELVAQWTAAQGALAQIDGDVARMNQLATRIAGAASLASYLLDTTRATYSLSGAIDEDHRQLGILQDDVNREVVQLERLLRDLSEDVARQTSSVGNERANLTALSVGIKNGSLVGTSLGGRSFTPVSSPAGFAPPRLSSLPASPAAVAADGRRPLVVIRFDRPNVAYEEPLYSAVSRAMERRPGAEFELVAVSPSRGSAAQVSIASNTSRRNAENVLRSLADMGLPLDRVRLSAMTSMAADTSEVHLYVR
ncbi:MAG: hypothetical protein FJX67_13425 [Alphaproteobacteria bacterium]|nr:hypothetical protein [Alphaproteobacteria bacterium]